jgi:hypothetical protein
LRLIRETQLGAISRSTVHNIVKQPMQIAATRGHDVRTCHARMILQEATNKVPCGPQWMVAVIKRVKQEPRRFNPAHAKHKSTSMHIDISASEVTGNRANDPSTFGFQGCDCGVEDAPKIGPPSDLCAVYARKIWLRAEPRKVGDEFPTPELRSSSPD